MRYDCEATRENLEVWALGALDDLDRRALENHLASCPDCSRLADAATETAAMLALAVPMRAAGASLKSRVMASARVLASPGRQGVSHWWRTAASAAAIVSIAAISWGTVNQFRAEDLTDDRQQVAAEATFQAREVVMLRAQTQESMSDQELLEQTIDSQNAALDVVFEPDVQWTTLDGTSIAPSAQGRCAWSREAALGAMIAQNLPPLPEDKSYTMWLIYENDWVSAGNFNVDEQGRGRLIMRKIWGNETHGRLLGFAVTLEDRGDADEPSMQLALASPLD